MCNWPGICFPANKVLVPALEGIGITHTLSLLKHAGQRLSMDSYEVCMAGKTQIGRGLGLRTEWESNGWQAKKREAGSGYARANLSTRRAHALILMFDLTLVSRLCQAGFRHGWSSRVVDVAQLCLISSFWLNPNNAKFISTFSWP